MPAFLNAAMMLVGTIAFSHASFNSLEKFYFVIFTTIYKCCCKGAVLANELNYGPDWLLGLRS